MRDDPEVGHAIRLLRMLMDNQRTVDRIEAAVRQVPRIVAGDTFRVNLLRAAPQLSHHDIDVLATMAHDEEVHRLARCAETALQWIETDRPQNAAETLRQALRRT